MNTNSTTTLGALCALLLSACGSLQSARIERGAYRIDGSGHERERVSVSIGRDNARSRITLGAERMIFEDGSSVPAFRVGIESTISEHGRARAFGLGSLGVTEFGGESLEPDFAGGLGAEFALSEALALRATFEHHWSEYGNEPALFLGITFGF